MERPTRGDRPERFPERRERADSVENGVVEQIVAGRVAEPQFVREAAAPVVVAEPVVVAPVAVAPAPRRRERLAETPHEQPEFLRRPVRRTRREPVVSAGDSEPAPVVADDTPTRD